MVFLAGYWKVTKEDLPLHFVVCAGRDTVGIPCRPKNDHEQVFDDPQARVRGLRIDTVHSEAEAVLGQANPIFYAA